MNIEIKVNPYGDRLANILLIAKFEKRAHFYTSMKCVSEKVAETKTKLVAMAIAWRINKYIKHRLVQYGCNPQAVAYCQVTQLEKAQAHSLQVVFGQYYTPEGLARVLILNEEKLRAILPTASSKFYTSNFNDLNNIITWAHETK